MKFTALTNEMITALQTIVDLSADKLDQLNKMVDEAYDHRVELSSSDYCGFDVCIDEVVFERVSNETGDTLKSYSVKFDAKEMTIEDDYEWNTDYDGGYGVYRALPKALRQHIEMIVWLSAQIDAEQDRLAEEQAQELITEDDKPEELNYASKVDEASDSFAEVKLIKHARNVYYVEVVYYKEGAVTSKDTDVFNGYWDAVDRFHEYAQVIGAESQDWLF